MTKSDIIKETGAFYTSENRGYDRVSERCLYVTPTGENCAVGRCLSDKGKELAKQCNGLGITTLDSTVSGLENAFKNEYKGHDLEFWSSLQYLHDNPENWDKNGLTEYGKTYMNLLLDKYQNQ